ncbi:hypothetical protein ACS3SW_04180 [Roseobacteraceae bacterium S113]
MIRKILTSATLLAFTSPAWAMNDGMAALDTDGDGLLSLIEVQTVFPEVTGDAFLTMDTNADGMLDGDEITAAEASGLLPAREG